MVKVDQIHMMALVERWLPVTCAFHLPMGEIGMPPIDFYMMMGLPMGGTPPLPTDELDLEVVRRCIESQPIKYYKGTKGVLASWFGTKYVWATDESSEGERDYSPRTFLLTRPVFCAKSDRVYFWSLPMFEHLDRVGSYSWGRSTLGWMYSHMSMVSIGQGSSAFLGLWFLWKVHFF